MQSQFVFHEEKELNRLGVQNRLLSCYEAPVFAKIFSTKTDLTVLDIGCNDGSKTVQRFSEGAVSKVIGLEYNEELAKNAQLRFGDSRFAFHPFDVECADMTEKLTELMTASGIDGFDVIYLSFVLMHLREPKRLLMELQRFLKPDGYLVIIEADDDASMLTPDEDSLLTTFLDMLKKDRYSGNREVGGMLLDMLSACDYDCITVWHDHISAGVGEFEKKKDIFDTFFSYLPEDVALLLEEDPTHEDYRAWAAWLNCHYNTLKHLIIQEVSSISMGMKIVSCMKGRT